MKTVDLADDSGADSVEDWGLWPDPPELVEFPPIRMMDLGDLLAVYAEMPGVREDDVDVRITHELVRIQGTRKRPAPKSYAAQLQEMTSGPFDRTIKLLSRVDPKSAKGRLESGVLTLTLQKVVDRPSSIPIRSL